MPAEDHDPGQRGVHQEIPPACAPVRVHEDPTLWGLCICMQEDQACQVQDMDQDQGQGTEEGDPAGDRPETVQGQHLSLP